jgi:transposase
MMKQNAPQREYPLRDLFNALRYLVGYGCTWRALPNDMPPWAAVHQQTQRWIKVGAFVAMSHNLRKVLRVLQKRASNPSAAILDA